MKKNEITPNMLLDFLGRKHDLSLEPPIDVYRICEILNIEIEERIDFDKLDKIGSISIDKNRPKIWLNKIENKHETRKRFTLAHEIGHYILHIDKKGGDKTIVDDRKSLSRSDSYWDTIEYEANNYAAQLLMPRKQIKEQAHEIIAHYKEAKNKNTMPRSLFIKRMARKFKVSEQAMEYRLKNSGFIK